MKYISWGEERKAAEQYLEERGYGRRLDIQIPIESVMQLLIDYRVATIKAIEASQEAVEVENGNQG